MVEHYPNFSESHKCIDQEAMQMRQHVYFILSG